MDNKAELRLKAKNIRKNLNISQISKTAVSLIRKDSLYKNSQNIMIYYPTKFEVDLRNLLIDNKKFYLPRVNGKNLEVCLYHTNCRLAKSSFNIMEPTGKAETPEILDMVIVPALMADFHKYRLGYGGGYYDRFLKKYAKNFKTITAIPKELLINSLPIDNFDQKIDEVIII